jgi:hypothetical protein
MKKAPFIVPALLLLLGVYALLTAFGSSGEQVALLGDHSIPRGLAFMFAAIGLGGGALVLTTMLGNKKAAADGVAKQGEP